MNFKDFIDVSINAGCEIGLRVNFQSELKLTPVRTKYAVKYKGNVYAIATWVAEDNKVAVTFRDEYLKWYQCLISYQYGWVEKKSDYAEKLARVIRQNNVE